MGKPEIRLGCQDGMAVAQYLCAQLVIDGQSRLQEGIALASYESAGHVPLRFIGWVPAPFGPTFFGKYFK